MASIRKDIPLNVPAAEVWDAVRDIGALHHRLVKGFVTDTKLEGDARIVTFANGMVAKEVIVDLDDTARRLVWSARSERLTHHNASAQVFADGDERSVLVWIADVLPNEVAGHISAMMDDGARAMKATFERR